MELQVDTDLGRLEGTRSLETDRRQFGDVYLTPSDVLEYLFCPRFIFYGWVLKIPQHQELRFKVQEGREVHEKKKWQNLEYLRKKLGVIKKQEDVKISSKDLHLSGRVDEVLFFADGTAAPLDYKFAEWKGRIFVNHRIQNILYGMLIRESFGCEVNRGYFVYLRSKSHLEEIRHGEGDRQKAVQVLNEILEIIQQEKYPKRTSWQVRCIDCCYKNICLK